MVACGVSLASTRHMSAVVSPLFVMAALWHYVALPECSLFSPFTVISVISNSNLVL